MTQDTKHTVFFDSECPICSAEMNTLAEIKNDDVAFVPLCHANLNDAERDAMYQQLHVRTKDGELLQGYDANIYLWQQTKGNNRFKRLATLLSSPPLSWLGRLGYHLWLRYYHARRRKRIS